MIDKRVCEDENKVNLIFIWHLVKVKRYYMDKIYGMFNFF